MFLGRRLFSLDTQFRSKKRPISRESIMVLNGAMEHEELTLLPVDGIDTVYKSDSEELPVFFFSDDEDLDDEDDFEDEEDNYEDEDDDDDDYDDDELDEDEDDDYDEDEDDDYEDEEDEEDWDDDYE
jgi:hypothetical protein